MCFLLIQFLTHTYTTQKTSVSHNQCSAVTSDLLERPCEV
jgi:hypothetical protein